MYLSQNISHLRKVQNINQNKLAELLEVGSSTVSGYEQGRILPTLPKLMKMRDIFSVNLEDLVYVDLSQIPSNNTSNDASFAKRLEELEARQNETDNLIKAIFKPGDYEKLLALFTDEMDMPIPELKAFIEREAEKEMKKREEE
jgi:transcriptional regulator with XRE-family HTH domain